MGLWATLELKVSRRGWRFAEHDYVQYQPKRSANIALTARVADSDVALLVGRWQGAEVFQHLVHPDLLDSDPSIADEYRPSSDPTAAIRLWGSRWGLPRPADRVLSEWFAMDYVFAEDAFWDFLDMHGIVGLRG